MISFSEPCIIHKNSKELQDFLIDLGYKFGGFDLPIYNDKYNDGCLYCCYDQFFIVSKKPGRSFSICQCGEDEELFKAVAAISRHTDYMQWFLIPEIHENIITYKYVQHKERNDNISRSIEDLKKIHQHRLTIPVKLSPLDISTMINNK
jgi:hypothetical protein